MSKTASVTALCEQAIWKTQLVQSCCTNFRNTGDTAQNSITGTIYQLHQ